MPPEIIAVLVGLVPVLLGGLLTTAGALVGPVFLHRVQRDDENRKKRREKFEELVGALYEFHHWLNKSKQIYVYGEEGNEGPSPFAKMWAISTIYFPQFSDAISELDTVSDQYELWMRKAAIKRLEKKIGELNDGFREVYDPYFKKFLALQSKMQEYAKKEFQ
jgi:hypothetical protein